MLGLNASELYSVVTLIFRHTTAKSGCFSPKTTKSGKRKSFKGFLRRLSGGKDQVRLLLTFIARKGCDGKCSRTSFGFVYIGAKAIKDITS